MQFPPSPLSSPVTISLSSAPLHGLQPWKCGLSASKAEQALHPHAPFLNQFSVLSHLSKIKTCKLLLLSLALNIYAFSFLFVVSCFFFPFNSVLCTCHRTCQKGHKWEKALDRRPTKAFQVNFTYRNTKFPAQDSSSSQTYLFLFFFSSS